MIVLLASFRVGTRPVLTGWMAAAFAFQSVPAGALCLQAMMRLIPGRWGEELRLTCEAGVLLTPLAGAAFLPVVLGMGWIYPWVSHPPDVAFQQLWLAPLPFAMRTILWFALIFVTGWLMRRRVRTGIVATATVIVFPLLGSLVGIDWLLSLTPSFASSAFGLQMLILMVTIAFAALLLLRLAAGTPPRRLWVLGGVLLTLMLLWAYLQFLPFFIVWSGNLPPGASWYLTRANPGWGAATIAFSVLGGVPLLLLIALPAARRDPRWLSALCVLVLAGKLIELAWFALPGCGLAGVLAYAGSCGALGLVAIGALRLAFKRRIGARLPAKAD